MTAQKSKPILIDGGLSAQLIAQGLDLNFPLWTAHYLMHDPAAIERAHLAYLEAGAQIIISSGYQASIKGFTSAGATKAEAQHLLRSTIHLAQSAAKTFLATNQSSSSPSIAASLGPYGAVLADGSEYHGNYEVSWDQVKTFHSERISVLDDMAFEWYACETLPSLREAEILAQILAPTKKKIWISFTCKDNNCVADGTPLEDCVRCLVAYPHITAIGVNCTAPEYILPLLRKIKPLMQSKSIVLYPNSGGHFDASTKEWLEPSKNSNFLDCWKQWLAYEPDIIGGCCRIGPGEIRQLKSALV